MKLGDRNLDSPEVDLARQSAPGAYRLLTDELTEADDVTDEGEFPEFGWFIRVQGTGGEQYIEVPGGLEKWLLENEIGVDDAFRILSVQKVDGEWLYDCEQLEDEDGQLE